MVLSTATAFLCWVVTRGEHPHRNNVVEAPSPGAQRAWHALSQSQPSCEEGGGRIIIVPMAVLKNPAHVPELAMILVQSRNRQANIRHFTETKVRKMAT